MTKEKFTELVLESEKTLYRVSMSMLKNETDCEDCVQTAILTAFEKLSDLKNEEYFKTWLVRILINACNKQLRHHKKQAEFYDEGICDNTGIAIEIREALDKLPQKIRQTVVLFYIEEFTVNEIKEILHIPAGTVKSRLSKGRTLLKEILDDE